MVNQTRDRHTLKKYSIIKLNDKNKWVQNKIHSFRISNIDIEFEHHSDTRTRLAAGKCMERNGIFKSHNQQLKLGAK